MELIDNSKNPKLIKSYENLEKGIVFYSMANPLEVSSLRGVAAERSKRFADMKISETTMKALIKEIKRSINVEQDFVKAFGIVQEIDLRLEMIAEEESILELVKLYYFLPDEDPNIPDDTHDKEKSKIFKEHPEVKAFFLQIGIILLDKFSLKSEDDVLIYLEKTKDKALRILQYLP